MIRKMINKSDYLIRVIDDDEVVRESLILMLETEGWNAIGYEDGDVFLRRDDRFVEGLLPLDVRMPHVNGLQLQERMLERGWDLPIIFVTGHADIDVAISTLKRGAVDFLLKPVDEDKLLEAIEVSLLREKQRKEGLSDEQMLRRGIESLSDRQKEILNLFMEALPMQW